MTDANDITMTAVSIVGPDDGETIQLGPAVQMRILEDGRTSGHRLGVAVGTLAPHTEGPPQHRHAEHDEGFYVISGTVRFTVDDTEHDAGPGTFVMVPPGAPHSFANPGDTPAVMLSTFTPDHYLQYFRDLRDLRPTTAEDVAAVMSRYATEVSPPSTRRDRRLRDRRRAAGGVLPLLRR